jgi:hypothetical protein
MRLPVPATEEALTLCKLLTPLEQTISTNKPRPQTVIFLSLQSQPSDLRGIGTISVLSAIRKWAVGETLTHQAFIF